MKIFNTWLVQRPWVIKPFRPARRMTALGITSKGRSSFSFYSTRGLSASLSLSSFTLGLSDRVFMCRDFVTSFCVFVFVFFASKKAPDLILYRGVTLGVLSS